MRHIGGREQLLNQPASGRGVHAHPPFLFHHVALLIKLALHRLPDAARLHVSPKLKPVGRHAPEVLRGVFARRRVQAFCAVLLGDLWKRIRDDVLLGCVLGVFEGLLQSGQLRRILADALAVLGIVGRVGDFDLGQCNLFGWIVGRADLRGALEGHVLEHMRKSGLAAWIIR
jgi:hypothetical protein